MSLPITANNAPKSEDFFVNPRGLKLHVRSFVPSGEIKGIVFFHHGLGGHADAKSKLDFGEGLVAQQLACFMLDCEGHGYSEGERCFIEKHTYLIDDYVHLIELVCSGGGGGAAADGGGGSDRALPSFHLSVTLAQAEQLKRDDMYYVLTGESMGGAISLLTPLYLRERKHPMHARFKGCGLLAPAIVAQLPPRLVIFLLTYLVVPFAAKRQVPSILESVNRPECTWNTPEMIAEVARDKWGLPGALGWGHNLKFGMGLSMIRMTDELALRLKEVDFPWLVLQDPNDQIVLYAGAKKLEAESVSPCRDIVEMDGCLHDLLSNVPDRVISTLCDWIQKRLAE